MKTHKLRDHDGYLVAATTPHGGDSVCGKGTTADIFSTTIPPPNLRHLPTNNLCAECWKTEFDAEAQIVTDAKTAENKRQDDELARLEAVRLSHEYAAAVMAENERLAAERVIELAKEEEERKAQKQKEAEERAAEKLALMNRIEALEKGLLTQSGTEI